MPHVIVKLYPGRSEQQKKQLADEIAKAVVAIAKCAEKSVSVAFEEIEPEMRYSLFHDKPHHFGHGHRSLFGFHHFGH